MKRTALVTIIAVFILSSACFAQQLNIPSYVTSPQAVANWFASDFEYVVTLGSRGTEIQPPEQTVALKTGQCGDFAYLASTVLARIGIESKVLILKYKGIGLMHAICIWQEKDGTYSFISNQEMFRTQKNTAEEAIRKIYPDCEKVFNRSPEGALVALW